MPKQEKVKINVKERLDDTTLDLSLSELVDVPVKDILTLKRATILDLSNNKIISLGKHFSQLINITKLDLSKNQIRYLPEDFGDLVNLRHLDLYNNRIERLPLSIGNLKNLRYLDLKANPLTPTLAKVVGPCLTTKDCHESAKNTVKFFAQMQIEVERAKQTLNDKDDTKIEAIENIRKTENTKNKKKKNKKSKKNQQQNDNNNLNGKSSNSPNSTKHSKNSLNSRPHLKCNTKSSTVFKTIILFFMLLVLNVIMLYIVTIKHPEIAEWLVELIPPNYRDMIVSKSEDMRLNMIKISNWIHKFKTPPMSPYY